jgi:hypothetical protein
MLPLKPDPAAAVNQATRSLTRAAITTGLATMDRGIRDETFNVRSLGIVHVDASWSRRCLAAAAEAPRHHCGDAVDTPDVHSDQRTNAMPCSTPADAPGFPHAAICVPSTKAPYRASDQREVRKHRACIGLHGCSLNGCTS